MSSVAKDQREYCKIAQLSQALDKTSSVRKFREVTDLVQQLDDVNHKFLNNKPGSSPLIGGTPLHIAAFYKHHEAFNSLLEYGADFTIQNKSGYTALHRVFIDLFHKWNKTPNTTTGTIESELINLVLKAHVQRGVIKNPRSVYGLSHFHIACAANHVAAVQLFIDAGESLDESTSPNTSLCPGYTPLHFAIRFCSYASAKLLLEHGANKSAKNVEGLTPLHLNIARNVTLNWFKNSASRKDVHWHGYLEESQKITSLLLDDNRVMDIDSMGFQESYAACTLANTSLAQRFLQEIDIDCTINMDSPLHPGCTHLHFAARFNVEIVKLLLRKGANIEAEDAEGKTPLDLCQRNFKLKDLHLILSTVPGVEDIYFSDNKTKLSDFIDATRSRPKFENFFQTVPKDVVVPQNSALWPGHGLLHLLVLFSQVLNFDMIAFVLSTGYNELNQRDAHGRTPIHLAFYRKKLKIVDEFLKDQPKIIDVIDNNGLSHLHIACEQSNADVVQILLSDNVNVNVVYKGETLNPVVTTGSTPLHIAVSKKSIQVIRMLIRSKADINATDADGMTPIHRLIQPPAYVTFVGIDNEKEIEKLLLASCDLKNLVSNTGLSHLHIASYAANKTAIEQLLKSGADANAICSCTYRHSGSCIQDRNCFSGSMPLNFAVQNTSIEIVNMLVQSGADILYKKPNGMTILYEVLVGKDLRGFPLDISIKRHVVSIFANDGSLKKRAKDDIGLTLLHVACYLRDIEQIQKLLAHSLMDVNAQMHKNSIICPKATPLHVLIKTRDKAGRTLDSINTFACAELLLKHGSDVTMMDVNGYTPVHLARFQRHWEEDDHYLGLISLLLGYHKDFSLNPIDAAGVSHFHLACLVGEYVIVEEFLKISVDVNLSVDYLNGEMTCQTPLLFMMKTPINLETHLRTIDVLLKYGADINVQDEKGLTPLLKVAHLDPPRERYFKKLCEAGADIECTDVNGKSVLEILLDSDIPVTKKELRFFFRYSCLFNAYNSVYKQGIISWAISSYHHFIKDRPYLLEAMMDVPSLFTVDLLGRTPIHNIVANYSSISGFDYAYYVERFIKMGYDIDAQDSQGKTALHLAAYFMNESALFGLLSAGADINLTDKLKRTALAMVLSFFQQNHVSESIEQAKNMIALHTIAMLLCGLEVNSHDLEVIEPEFFKVIFLSHREQVSRELEMTNLVTVGTGSLTLKNLLSETGVVASRPLMTSENDRQAIDNLLEFIDFESFPKIKGLIKLQYKKMLTRLSIIHPAIDSVRQLIGDVNGFLMPEICCCMILRFLSNSQVKNLIEAMSLDNTE